jgi:hypothetical protein
MKQLILARFNSSTSAVATAHCHHALISQAMRTLLILVSWLTVFGSQQLVQAQQILCQQQFGKSYLNKVIIYFSRAAKQV